MNSPTWAITGAAGYLGSHVTEQLIARGQKVVAIDNLSGGRQAHLTPFASSGLFALERADVRDCGALTQAFVRHSPAIVVHLAALHFIPAAVADPSAAVGLNVHGTQCVLQAARQAGVETFWFASTGDVYAPSELPHRETDACAPFNIYGLSKLLGEQLVALESKLRPDARYFVGRLFNLYGPRETNPHILPEVLSQIRQDPDRPLRLGNLSPQRDLVPVADAARAVIESAIKAPPGLSIMNVATGVAWSMRQVLDLINELLDGRLRVETDPAKVRAVERNHLQADVALLMTLLGWTPHSDLRRGLRELLASEKML